MADAEHGPRAIVELVQGERSIVLGPLPGCPRGDLAILEDLLRLQLSVRRLGWRVRISESRQELRELVELLGLTEHLS